MAATLAVCKLGTRMALECSGCSTALFQTYHTIVRGGLNANPLARGLKVHGSARMRYERGYVDFGRPPPPVKEGDVLTVKIEGMGSSGDGLARIKGFVIFVPGVKMDEEVTVRVTKVSRKVGFAEKVEE